MTANEFLTIIAQISGLVAVVSSTLAMGMSLTVPQIVQPLKNARLVVLALLANFLLMPLLAYAILMIVLMLIPLVLGMLIKSNSPETAKQWQPVMTKIGGVALLTLLVVGLGLNVSNVINLIGTGGFLALLLFVIGSLLIGFVIGGRDPGVRIVTTLGTAQRNVTAALLVTLQNFAGTTAVPYVLVTLFLLPLILIPTAKFLGARSQTAEPT